MIYTCTYLRRRKLMARNTGPTWRISRRLNFSILETGEELTKRPYIPGMHGSPTRRIKQSNYGLQKAEKRLALIPSEYLSANAELDSALTTYDEGIADKASENYSDLDFLIPEFKTVADSTNQELRPLKENVIRKADSLSWICPPVKITPTCSAL